MSFAGFPGGAVGAGANDRRLYFCHSCNRSVSLAPSSPESDLVCPDCNGGFIEEIENPSPSPSPNPFLAFSGGPSPGMPSLAGLGLPFLFSSSSSSNINLQNPNDLSAIFGSDTRTHRSTPTGIEESQVFNPLTFLQTFLSNSGANIEFIIENNPGDADAGGGGGGGFRLPANFGDYFIGPGFEQLIQQLAENDPNRYGTPPASKSAIETLLEVNISEEMLSSDSEQCAVCKDMFELGTKSKQMPCKHIYHPDCILPWLELHNSCPVCRYELPTDDPEYEQRNRETAASQGSGGINVGAQDGSLPPRTTFRVPIPTRWPFRASPTDTSGSGAGTNNANNDGGSNSGNRDFGSETRQEDLD